MDTTSQMDLVKELLQADINRPVKYLYDHYFETVATDIRMSGGNADDAADIFQESVLIVIEKIKNGKFKGNSSVKTFLLGIARNLWLHEQRARQRRSGREIQYSRQEEEEMDFHERLFARSNVAIIKNLLDMVGELCGKILTGVYYEKLSMKELLKKFDYENEQVLRNRKASCMKKLKKILSENPKILDQLKNLSIYE